MRLVSSQTYTAWKSSWKGGPTQPCARATIEPFLLVTVPYDGNSIATTYVNGASGASALKSKPRNVRGNFAVAPFNAGRQPKELPNIKTVKWERNVESDTGSLTLELWNTSPLPIGQSPVDDNTFDLPGYFSAGRGAANEPSSWGNIANEWQGMLAPDRCIRLYEGYGFDASVPPDKDPHLYPAGVWIIDEVTYGESATITVQCRDLGRVLMEQIAMKPVIPADEYPLSFQAYGTTPVSATPVQLSTGTTGTTGTTAAAGLAWRRFVYETDSNKYFVGKSLTNNLGAPLVNSGGDVSGHYGLHAFDSDMATFWFSVGAKYTTVPRWVQGSYTVPLDVAAVSIKPYGGPYNVWISVKSNGVWQGTPKVPYTNGTDYIATDAVIPYVQWATVTANTQTTVKLPVDSAGSPIYKNVTKVRVTFTSLKQVGTGDANWHAGCYDIQVQGSPSAVTANGTATSSVTSTTSTGATTAAAVATSTTVTVNKENICTYSDAVKWIAAWGGFYWPGGSNALNSLVSSDGSSTSVPGPGVGDPIFPPAGRVWGDIEEAGVGPSAAIPASQFDKKPLLDCIAPGTPVKTRRGLVDVEALRLGDEVATAAGWGRILGIRSAPHCEVMQIHVGGREIICSRGHRFLTTEGWRRADEIGPGTKVVSDPLSGGEALRGLRDLIQGEADAERSREDMLAAMQVSPVGSFQAAADRKAVRVVREAVPTRGGREEVLLAVVRPNISTDSFARDLCRLRRRVQAQEFRAEVLYEDVLLRGASPWAGPSLGWSVHAAVTALAGAGRGLVSRVLDVATGDMARDWAHPSGLGEPVSQDCRGGGRSHPSNAESNCDGSEPGRLAAVHRVDRVQVLRSGDREWTERYSDADSIELYDLTVSGHPSFRVTDLELVSHNCIATIRDVLGFNLFFSELGGIVFRSPNIWETGNYVSPITATESPNGPANLGRTPDILDLKDDETILGISTTLSSRNVRETVIVGNTVGSLGATANLKTNQLVGPFKTDMRRLAMWTDQNFATAKECLVMAELIMLRQAFTYRTSRVRIPGMPAIQVDDQVRIWERLGASTYLNYVSGISSQLDMRDGKWTYDLTTHWLGVDPFTDWAFSPGDLSQDTRTQVGVTTPTTGTTGTTTTTTGQAMPANYGWFHTGSVTYTQASIAARYQISVSTLKSLNPKLPDPVGPGYQVKVRTNYGPLTTTAPETTYSTYGWWQATATSYTINSVAGSYSVSVNALRTWNQWLVGNTVTKGQWVQVRSDANAIRTS